MILTETYLKVPEVHFAFAYVQQSVNKMCFPKTTTPESASWILDIHFPELKLKLELKLYTWHVLAPQLTER